MFISFLRTLILYPLLLLVVRLMGKRQLGQMEPAEFVVAMLLADLAAVPMPGHRDSPAVRTSAHSDRAGTGAAVGHCISAFHSSAAAALWPAGHSGGGWADSTAQSQTDACDP